MYNSLCQNVLIFPILYYSAKELKHFGLEILVVYNSAHKDLM